MSDSSAAIMPVTSPELPTDSGIVKSRKDFVFGLTMDLTDSQAQQAFQIILPIKNKWSAIFRSRLRGTSFTVEQAMKLVDSFEDELITTLADRLSLIATVDASPVFMGEPLIIDFVGCLDGHDSAKYGFDHEKEAWEVRKAKDRSEQFLGEKQSIDNKAKLRDRNERKKS